MGAPGHVPSLPCPECGPASLPLPPLGVRARDYELTCCSYQQVDSRVRPAVHQTLRPEAELDYESFGLKTVPPSSKLLVLSLNHPRNLG